MLLSVVVFLQTPGHTSRVTTVNTDRPCLTGPVWIAWRTRTLSIVKIWRIMPVWSRFTVRKVRTGCGELPENNQTFPTGDSWRCVYCRDSSVYSSYHWLLYSTYEYSWFKHNLSSEVFKHQTDTQMVTSYTSMVVA